MRHSSVLAVSETQADPLPAPRWRGGRAWLAAGIVVIPLLAAGCWGDEPPAGSPSGQPASGTVATNQPGAGVPMHDIHSYAPPDGVHVKHMEMDLRVQFAERVIDGTVIHHLTGTGPDLRLDTRGLEVIAARAGAAGTDPGSWAGAAWSWGRTDAHLGTELLVQLPPGSDRVQIHYRTSPEATGLQWLAPEQTAGGVHPFLYTQSQAIHARSWIPCQDSPAIRVTYAATLRADRPLRAVMAASPLASRPSSGETDQARHFAMPYAIPTYLIALAVGDLAFEEVGSRTGVWAEPKVLEKAVWEFADMEKMLEATEKFYGPYRWERYDVLVLPPSFPFGGMENPMLTFLTPTILAGDRSLVALVAHELAHSWSGNLVTNATWADFWLNEGFTTYIERRIVEAVYGPRRVQMEWMLGRQELEEEFSLLADKPGDQALRVNLAGRDPDDGMTRVPYEKGAHLLWLIEESYGREAFDAFLRRWFDEHAFTSVTTAEFIAYARANLLGSVPLQEGRIRPMLDEWIDKPSMPGSAPVPRANPMARVDSSMKRWRDGRTTARDLQTSDWTTHHWLHFLRALPDDVAPERLAELDEAFELTRTGNFEILQEWLVVAVRRGYHAADARLEEFLTIQGRRKYLKPIYMALMEVPGGRERAAAIYAQARPLYHAVSRRTLDEIVGWKGAPEVAGSGS